MSRVSDVCLSHAVTRLMCCVLTHMVVISLGNQFYDPIVPHSKYDRVRFQPHSYQQTSGSGAAAAPTTAPAPASAPAPALALAVAAAE